MPRECGETAWYFFSLRDRKYPKGNSPSRSAGRGYWKATGRDKDIFSNGIKLGARETLVFFIKMGKEEDSVKTNWIMQEYRLESKNPRQRMSVKDMKLDDWVLCKIYHRNGHSLKSSKKEDHTVQTSDPTLESDEKEIMSPSQMQNQNNHIDTTAPMQLNNNTH
ncbi:hypothetical protein IFM89_006031 [Coptis chinensis]|uniref:NAC domain-containing protein n=1 Tax=Coptis chinensis TaxID=261450 RepID=A0A835I069_9MAGN|nr:hypothetical protein IFM89_006031 [Coptis chinensis]